MSKDVLIIHRALAPYRVDFFKLLCDRSSCELVFLLDNLQQANYRQKDLIDELGHEPEFLTEGLNFGRRVIYRRGLIRKVLSFKGNCIILYEFGPLTLYLSILMSFLRRKMCLVIMTDDSDDVLAKSSTLRRLSRKIILAKARGVICSSSRVKQFFVNKSIPTAYFPIIQNELKPEFKCRTSRRDLDFLYVGRFSPEKNVLNLIDAFSEYKSLTSDHSTLTLVGDGPQMREVLGRIKKHRLSESIKLLGWLEGNELYSIYRRSKYLVLPSLTERFGAVVNEALIFGLAVMCSSRAGACELISENNGVIFNPTDQESLLDSFVEVKSKEVGINGMPFSFLDFEKELLRLIDCRTCDIE